MRHKSWRSGFLVVCLLLVVSGCATQSPPAPTSSEQGEPTIPSDSPLAKIHNGMGMAELMSLLGQPTDQEVFMTGKAFIPLYFGADTSVIRLHYKGLGRIYVSGGGAFGGGQRVINIEYDPQESGFRKY